jgi:hypothetical protein
MLLDTSALNMVVMGSGYGSLDDRIPYVRSVRDNLRSTFGKTQARARSKEQRAKSLNPGRLEVSNAEARASEEPQRFVAMNVEPCTLTN